MGKIKEMMCRMSGHVWRHVGDQTRCRRCGLVCNHEGLDFSRGCRFRCGVCGNDQIVRHQLVTSEDGIMRCTKCGHSEIDWPIRTAYLKESERKNREMQENRIMKAAMQGEDQFRCECCRTVKPVGEMTKEYRRPLCRSCVSRKLIILGSHVVYETVDGYEKTVTCVKCGREEFWRDAEHQGALLSDSSCI